MSLIDLLRMSSGNLKRRKLRTFLTVLGVVIGTASIVVMISLGLGLQQSTYKEIEKSGGLTTIQVTGKDRQGGMMVDSGEESKEYITDDVIEKLKKLENVYHFFFFQSFFLRLWQTGQTQPKNLFQIPFVHLLSLL